MTHGAVSLHVRLLEESLGAPLFERHNRRVVLTPAAKAYFINLEEIGPLFGQLSQAAARYGFAGTVSRTLSVNAPATFTLRWLVPRLAKFRVEHFDVDVKVETSNESLESLKDIYDIVIRRGPDTFYGYSMRPFLSEETVPICSPALLQRVPLRMPEDMRQYTLLHTSSLLRLWPDWLARAQIPALRPAAALTFDHFYLTLQAANDGIASRWDDCVCIRRSRGWPACHAVRRVCRRGAIALTFRIGSLRMIWACCSAHGSSARGCVHKRRRPLRCELTERYRSGVNCERGWSHKHDLRLHFDATRV